MTTAVILAAGKSERMGAGVDKAFLSLLNKPVIAWSLIAFERSAAVDAIVLVTRKDQIDASKAVARMFGISKLKCVVAGGSKRQESVKAGLAVVDNNTKYVVVHDGARPLVDSATVTETVEALKKAPAVTVGRRMTDTVKRVERGTSVVETVDREKLWIVQTPQAFHLKTLLSAYAKLGKTTVTDDCQAVELAGEQVRIIESRRPNFKITVPEDLQLAAALLK
ncbi:MAG: 2-C-methyl-D-erythritol 4-phosphate cytidylyltransferase [Kiritimatiellae bacterium]|nr:2-C-methyl-D-erythritol 4-phosphate cytidylyltransferase [Kiritimatiellia bacterium]